jgi:uncharacterized protein (UPF0248 family)
MFIGCIIKLNKILLWTSYIMWHRCISIKTDNNLMLMGCIIKLNKVLLWQSYIMWHRCISIKTDNNLMLIGCIIKFHKVLLWTSYIMWHRCISIKADKLMFIGCIIKHQLTNVRNHAPPPTNFLCLTASRVFFSANLWSFDHLENIWHFNL